jgi:hypothetical protein
LAFEITKAVGIFAFVIIDIFGDESLCLGLHLQELNLEIMTS